MGENFDLTEEEEEDGQENEEEEDEDEDEDNDDDEDDDEDDEDEDGSLILGHSSVSSALAPLPKHVGAAVGAAVTPRE